MVGLLLLPFFVSGTDLGAWPDCWVFAESSAPSSIGWGRVALPPPNGGKISGGLSDRNQLPEKLKILFLLTYLQTQQDLASLKRKNPLF